MISHRESEQAVLNHIRRLQADRHRTAEEDILMNKMARAYLDSSPDAITARRRAHDLLRIAAEAA